MEHARPPRPNLQGESRTRANGWLLVPLLYQAAQSAEPRVAWPEYVAVAIAGVSLVGTIAFGLANRATARRALQISERQEARHQSVLGLYLIEPVAWSHSELAERILGFHVLVSNPTDRPTSVVSAELHLTYSVGGVLTTVKVPAVGEAHSDLVPADLASIELPGRVDANDALAGWLLFRISPELIGGAAVERHELVIRDVHGIEERLQVAVFRELRREVSR